MNEHVSYADLSEDKRALVDSFDPRQRRHAADMGFGLDKLVADTDPNVRCSVVAQRYGLHKLIYDDDPIVREAVAWEEFGLGILKSDKNIDVRCAVAHISDRFWAQLKGDSAWEVRQAVAWEGGYPDELIHDSDPRVREAAMETIEDRGRIESPSLSVTAEQARESIGANNSKPVIETRSER